MRLASRNNQEKQDGRCLLQLTKSEKTATWEPRKNTQNFEKYPGYDKLSDQGYTSLPKPDESESGKMVLE